MSTKIKKSPKVRSEQTKEIDTFGALGRTMKISSKSHVSINKSGYSVTYYVPTVDVLIGIGKDHVATLIMDTDAWEALKSMTPINITTLKEWQETFYKPTRTKSNKAGGKK